MSKSKIILFDIETFPLESYTWGIYDQNVVEVKKEWELASFAYKELEDSKTYCYSRQDFKDKTDKSLAKKLWEILDSADVVIAHNGDAFDIKKAKARFIHHKLPPLSPFKSLDTKKMAKKAFNFTSNKLDDLGKYLGVGRKVDTGGFKLWLGCMAGDKASWKKMIDYNKKDVLLLERVYLKLRPWAGTNHNLSQIIGEERVCPICESTKLKSQGWYHNKTTSYRLLRCLKCSGYVRSDEKAANKSKYQAVA